MTCCLTAPKHYTNQYWLIVQCVLWHSPSSNLTGSSRELNLLYVFGFHTFNITTISPRCQWDSPKPCVFEMPWILITTFIKIWYQRYQSMTEKIANVAFVCSNYDSTLTQLYQQMSMKRLINWLRLPLASILYLCVVIFCNVYIFGISQYEILYTLKTWRCRNRVIFMMEILRYNYEYNHIFFDWHVAGCSSGKFCNCPFVVS